MRCGHLNAVAILRVTGNGHGQFTTNGDLSEERFNHR